jgi:hypothetical protein
VQLPARLRAAVDAASMLTAMVRNCQRGWGWILRLGLSLAVLVCCAAVTLAAETIPSTEAENLLGEKIKIAASLNGKVGVLLLGFSHASGTNVGVWEKRLAQDYGANAQVVIYQMPILESVPRLVRGMMSSGMRKDIPKDKQANFLLVYHDEAEWKQVCGYQKSDDAFIVLGDKTGEIRWRGSGDGKLGSYATLHQQIQVLLVQ